MSNKRLLGIEISDLGVTAARWDQSTAELLPLGPDTMELSGFAQLTGKGEVVFGRHAFEQFLTSELPVDNQYWHRLGTAGKDTSTPQRRKSRQPSHTELAQAHLMTVFKNCRKQGGEFDEVVLAAPGHFKRSNLGWLLQISESAGFRVKHVLDSSLASLLSASRVPDAKSFVVMDIHWNTAEAGYIASTDSGLERRDVAVDRALGLRQVLDRLVAGLAKRFIDEFRFDPSARPEYAQELYNRLSHYLSKPDEISPCNLRTPKGAISVDRGALAEMMGNELRGFSDLAGRAISQAAEVRDCAVFFSPRIARVPGLMEVLQKDHGVHPRMMETGQAATGAVAFGNALSDDTTMAQPLFHTAVEFDVIQETSGETASISQGQVYHSGRDGILGPTHPTHILFQGRLLALPEFGEADFAIGKDKSIASGLAVVEPVDGLAECHAMLRRKKDGGIELTRKADSQIWINGASFTSNGAITLQVGDVITLGAPILQVMIVGMAGSHA